MKWAIIPLFALLLIPASAFGQSTPVETITGLELHPDEQYRESTYIKQQDGYTWELDIETGELYRQYDIVGVTAPQVPEYPKVTERHTLEQTDDGKFKFTSHNPYAQNNAGDFAPYYLNDEPTHTQVSFAGGKMSFDKSECAVTYFDRDDKIIIKSETYNVRTAQVGTDIWNHLPVNDQSCTWDVESDDYGVIVTMSKVDSDGLFDLEYLISPDGIKTTAYFTNQSYQNNKFAFTQSVQLDDPILVLNGDEYDLSQMRGANFDRETLEQNKDLILEAKEILFQAGIGFEQLWSVNISDTVPLDVTQINLDYGNQTEDIIGIGETHELDPYYVYNGSIGAWPTSGYRYFTSNATTNATGCLTGTMNYSDQYHMAYIKLGVLGNTGVCGYTYLFYDMTGIPDDAVIDFVGIKHYSNCWMCTSDWSIPNNFQATDYLSGPSKHGKWKSDFITPTAQYCPASGCPSASAIEYQMVDGSTYPYTLYLDDFPGAGKSWNWSAVESADLGASAVSDLQTLITNGDNEFSMVWVPGSWPNRPLPYNGSTGGFGIPANLHAAEVNYYGGTTVLEVIYDIPPDEPTNLSATQTVVNQADVSWTDADSNSDYIVSSNAVNYPNDIVGGVTSGWTTWPSGATPTAPSLNEPGVIGNGAYFNGSTDAIGEYLLNVGETPTAASISAWIMPTDTSATPGTPFSSVGFGNYWLMNGQWSGYYADNVLNAGSLYTEENAINNWSVLASAGNPTGTGGNWCYQSTGSYYGDGDCNSQWHHVVITIDDAGNSGSGEQHVYINGVDLPLYTYPGGPNAPGGGGTQTNDPQGKTASNMINTMMIGGHYHPSPMFKYPFKGYIDEFIVFDVALTHTEAKALYGNTTPINVEHPKQTITNLGLEDNVLTYLSFDETSFPMPNNADTSDPTTVTYNIIRDGTQIATGVSGSSYNDTTVSAPNTYVYKAQAITSFGTSVDSNTSSVSIIGVPSVPLSVATTDGVPIVIDWATPSSDGGSAITGYNLYRDGSLLSNLGVVLTYSDSAVVGGTTYSYQVSAVNSLGESPLSAGVNGFAAIPPTAAQNLSASIPDPLDQPHDVVITFDEPSDWGSGTPQSYLLFESVGNNTSYNLVSTVSYSAGSQSVAHSISNIQPITDYYFKVQSESSHAIGPDSNEDNVTTPNVPDTPSAPTGIVTDPVNNPLVIDLTWTNPTSNGGSNIKGWMIERWDNVTGVFSTIVANTGNTNLTYTDSGLNASTDYKYRVSAINNVGTSPASPESATITTPSAPGSPVLTIPSESTTLTWTEPTSTSAITSYNIYRNSALLTSTTALTYVDHTITMALPYTYEVAGVSAAGVGTTSNAITTTPRNVITDLFASGTTGTGTILAWTEPPYYQGNVSGYEIQYTTPHGAPNLILTADTGSNIPVFYVSQLSYDTDYSFFVTPLGIAPYDMPPSAASNIINMTTDEDLSITNYTVGQFDLEATNTNIVSTYQFTRTNAGTGANATVTVDVLYPTTYDISCDVSYDMAGTTTTYDSLVVTPINADKDQVSFVFTGTTNDVLTLQCIDQLTGIESTPYIVVQEGNFPLLNQITAFRDGSYGTEGMFGAVDLITIFIVIISMIGFNRINPFVGVFMSVGMLSVLSYFGLIQWVTAMTGALATLFMWAFMRMRAR